MHFSLSLKRLVHGQHFLSGLIAAIGVIGLGLLAHWWADAATAMALSTGVLCASLVDLPASLRHKGIDLLAAAFGGALVTLLIAFAHPLAHHQGAAVLLIGFVAAMLTGFGKRAMPLSFSLLLAMVLVLGSPAAGLLEPAAQGLLFIAGALAYAVYALVAGWGLRRRLRRQALAESLFELATFARVSADYFREDAPLDACCAALVAQQGRVSEKQQGARDLVFEALRSGEDWRFVALLKEAVDLYETLLSGQTDLELLRRQYAGSDTLALLHDLAAKFGVDLEAIAIAVLRHRQPAVRVRYQAELFALEHEIARAPEARLARGAEREAHEALKGTVYKLRRAAQQSARLHALLEPSAELPERDPVVDDPSAFVSPPSYTLARLRAAFGLQSPVLRHAVRSTLALACGAAVASFMPQGAHGYWILLTIVVIMRSSFAAMRQRYGDRLMGNLIGCLAAAAVLALDPPPAVVVALLFGCVTVAHTFVTLNYRTTSIAACLLALLHLSYVQSSEFLVVERLIDTAIGAGIAFVFSYLWPSWEYRSVPGLVRTLRETAHEYARLVLVRTPDELRYRLARKALFEAIANLSLAQQAMAREPKSARSGLVELQALVADGYRLAVQLVAVRFILKERAGEFDADAAAPGLDKALAYVRDCLEIRNPAIVRPEATQSSAVLPTADPGWPADWNMTTLLQRRLALMERAAASLRDDVQRLPQPLR
ncbi:MAG: FUSC family protein [Rhodocyclaceae bacterium]|nr:FUSC family protein [Rhodocyclaceae bacterium]